MMLMCDASIVAGYDRRRSGLPSAPVIMEHDDNRDHRDNAVSL